MSTPKAANDHHKRPSFRHMASLSFELSQHTSSPEVYRPQRNSIQEFLESSDRLDKLIQRLTTCQNVVNDPAPLAVLRFSIDSLAAKAVDLKKSVEGLRTGTFALQAGSK